MCRHTSGHTKVRNIACHHRIRPYNAIPTNMDISDNRAMCADPGAITDSQVAMPVLSR